MFNPRKTTLRRVSAEQPDCEIIEQAATLLRLGMLVAFPTETVYGLGANALHAPAVESIFAAKGRPSNNPIIVHVADVAAARRLAADWPERASLLAEKFWPGPLTIVLPKRAEVPDIVTAGSSTVGLRVPAHPVALALLRAAEIPIAAPSANRSMRISPTTANHVLRGLDGRIDFVLDAGPTSGGLESTVLDLTTDPPQLLRPGLITVDQLEAIIGPIASGQHAVSKSSTAPLRSPGMLERHYAPRAKVVCISAENRVLVQELLQSNQRLGWLRLAGTNPELQLSTESNKTIILDMPADAAQYSARLYAALHELDDAGVDQIVVDLPPGGDAWLAVHDRLRRAASGA
jgi:L-threonylcarbamoyladenylate synthase